MEGKIETAKKEETTEEKSKKTKEKQKEMIEKTTEYLAIKMGVPGLNFSNFRLGKDEETTYYETYPIKKNDKVMGIFKMIISEMVVSLMVYDDKKNNKCYIQPGFSYKHHDGGRNGHDFDFILEYQNKKLFEN